ESHGFLRGMVALVGFKQTFVEFYRPARTRGKSKYNRLVGSLRNGLNGLFCFSNDPLSFATVLGFIFIVIAGIAGAFLLFDRRRFFTRNGFLTMLIFLEGGVQLISVGILGEYIGRIYDEVRQRPRFIVERKIGFD